MPSASCPFCNISREMLTRNQLAFALYEAFPVSPGHGLVVPIRHVCTIFDLDAVEYSACRRRCDHAQAACTLQNVPWCH
jgi:diadenosine tetraphosphate (Ap4A) HIT family hydrolase